MQLIRSTSTTPKRKALRPVVAAAAATLLLAGWTSAAKADVLLGGGGSMFSTARFIPSSAFTTPPPATVFGDLPTAAIISTNTGTSYNPVQFFSFNAVQGQTIRLDIDNVANGGVSNGSSSAPFAGTSDLSLALYSGNGALLAYNENSPLDPGSILTFDGYNNTTASRDPFIGDYKLTYPNSNLYGTTPINSPLDPNRNTYYVAVLAGGRFGVTPITNGVASLSPLTRPDGESGGTAYNYSSLGYAVNANSADGTPSFDRSGVGVGSYTLQFSLGAAPNTAPVPEPGTMALMGLGIAGLAASRRRKKNKSDVSAAIA